MGKTATTESRAASWAPDLSLFTLVALSWETQSHEPPEALVFGSYTAGQ